jgi:hypothetical protein
MNSWSNEELARLLRPQQATPAVPEKPRRPSLFPVPAQEHDLPADVEPDRLPALRSVPTGPGAASQNRAAGVLAQQEIDALMRSLNRGTELRLKRQATPEELQRLVNAVNSARRLELLAVEAMYGGASIYWSGTDWVFERPPRAQRAA